MLGKTQAQFEIDSAARWASYDEESAARELELGKTEFGRETLKRMAADPDPDASGMGRDERCPSRRRAAEPHRCEDEHEASIHDPRATQRNATQRVSQTAKLASVTRS